MPTILLIMGWRFFFYTNEGDEPIHIHVRKAEKECKYWLDVENFEAVEAYSYAMNSKDKKQVKKIIYDYFDYIESEWKRVQQERGR